jgi:GDP-mannose 6-dehydrogenase
MTPSISVFGLGYVGCVSAACLAREGFRVVGVDVSDAKVSMVNSGTSTIIEEGIADLVASTVSSGAFRATSSVDEAIMSTDISLVCVGTPSRPNGSLDLSYIERVCTEIGTALRNKAARHVIAIRSTVLPGSTHDVAIPALEQASGKRAGKDFLVCFNPEFLREGTSIRDFDHPPFTVIGCDDPAHAEPLAALYARLQAPLFVVEMRVAELLKYACNCFHALKIGFANEIGNVSKALGIDSHDVMRIFCEDTKLNISPAYLRPGFAFGGSCLPKDLRALSFRAQSLDVPTPILSSILPSNERQVSRAFDMVVAAGHKEVGVIGLAFKEGTDDLRESPMVTLIERLLGKGYNVVIYDRDVYSARLIGSNREYIEREIPHIFTLLMGTVQEVIAHGKTLVVGARTPELIAAEPSLPPDIAIVDLVRAFGPRRSVGSRYNGMCW